MINASTFYDLVSGRRRGATAAIGRMLLAAGEWPYAAAVAARNWRYDHGLAAISVAGAPVISVGNLTVGGTGKTPVVAMLARWFATQQVKVVVLSRGYRAANGETNDEAAELARLVPNTIHLQQPDRVAAADVAVRQHGAQLLLLDDGFQHRRLARQLDVVLIDSTQPFGFRRLLPRGALREPLRSLRRAQVVIVTRRDLVDDAAYADIQRTIRRHAPQAVLVESVQQPSRLLMADGSELAVESLRGKRVAAFCGIGNPAAFRITLERLGAKVVAWREYPDHFRFGPGDVAGLSPWLAATNDAQLVVCTLKDLVKIPVATINDRPLAALAIETKLTAGASQFEAMLAKLALQATHAR